MSRIVVVVLAILGLCRASSVTEDACKNFLKDSKFNSSSLDGTWTAVYLWPRTTVDMKAIFHYRSLSPEEVTPYQNETSSSYPAVSWEKVKYEMTLYESNDDIATSDTLTYLLEIVDDTGNINAILSGDHYDRLKKTQSEVKTRPFAYKLVGEYVAVKFCDNSRDDAFLMQKGTKDDAAVIERAASTISSTISKSQGGVAVFIKPKAIPTE